VGASEIKVSIPEIAAIAYSADSRRLPDGESYGLEAINFYDPPFTSISYAVHIACVEVDTATCLTKVKRYIVVHDCGRVVNPTIVEGQLHGAIAQGIGQALMEAVVYDREGQLITAHLLDYVLPTALDVPDIVVEHMETPSLDTVGGFKGVGENGIIGAVPAIANAVNDALSMQGRGVNRLPLHPAYISNFIYDSGSVR
jgi:carbon-monoxide dehydrogenase large subunit